MNFKPKMWKIIGSLIIAIVLTIIFSLVYSPCNAVNDTLEAVKKCSVSPLFYLIEWIIFFIIIYILWSLIERKNNSKK